MGLSNSKQICFLIQVHTTGAFNGMPPTLDLHRSVLTNNVSELTFTNGLDMSLVSFKHRKYQTEPLLN